MSKLEPFERRVEIIKLLHGKEMRTSEIADYFEVDERTIRTDVDSLRVGLDVLGTKIKIESKSGGSQKHYYKSTVHPIMLALNLSELFALLKLLENASKNHGGELYKKIFQDLYSQMTDYAENRLSGLLEGTYDKSEIINRLEEEAFATHKDYKLVFWQKSGGFIEISYLDKHKGQIKEKVKLLDIKDNIIQVERKDGEKPWLDYDDIVVDWSEVEYK